MKNKKLFCLGAWTLWQREMVRFYRQPSRVIGALGTPLLFWVLIGSGIGSSFRMSESALGNSQATNYLLYFFPGSLLMILLFTAIFSTISLIEDRKEGFFQSVLVAPIPRESFVLGKILGGSTLALIQAILFLLMAFVLGIPISFLGWLLTILVLFVNAFALTALGFVIAWNMHSIQGFHAVMNLFLMPLWFLSGALFPPEGAPVWIRWVMQCNPLSYGMAALRMAMYGHEAQPLGFPNFILCLILTLLFGIVLFVLGSFFAGIRRVEDLS